jgi:hypothetical protein
MQRPARLANETLSVVLANMESERFICMHLYYPPKPRPPVQHFLSKEEVE